MEKEQGRGGTSPAADLVIAGSGPAGIAIARELAHQTHLRICLVESGHEDFCEDVQELARGETVGIPYYALDQCRFRRVGGSMNGWPAVTRHAPTSITPMDPLDFEPRPWAGNISWPFSRAALDPFYAKAQALFASGPWAYDPADWRRASVGFQPLDPARLVHRIWQYAPGCNFGRKFLDELRRAGNVEILTGRTVVEILTDPDGGRAVGVRTATLDGRRQTIPAKAVVLACGAIENARLLLLSTAAAPAGLGNGHDLVGRHFMEHPHLSCATVRFPAGANRRWVSAYKPHRIGTTTIRAGICLSEEAQRRLGALNFSGILVDQFVVNPATGRQSPGYVALKSLLAGNRSRRSPAELTDRFSEIAADLPAVLKGGLYHMLGANGAIYARSEQAPNPDSRVTLGHERDRLGLPVPRLDWRLSPIDKHTIRVAVETIRAEFSRLKLGTVTPEPWLAEDDRSWPPWLKGGYHHMGTTRMSETPRQGVVDPDCRVFGISNLYVAGSSVFPTGGYANPTLTLVALAIRLADRLKAELRRPEATVAPSLSAPLPADLVHGVPAGVRAAMFRPPAAKSLDEETSP